MTSSNQDWLFHRLAPFYDYLIRRPQVNRLKALSLFVRLIISGLALLVIFSDAYATSDLSESQLLQLKSGAVLVDVKQADEPSKGMVEATILIDAPAESIWQIMVNCHEIPTFVPGLKDCTDGAPELLLNILREVVARFVANQGFVGVDQVGEIVGWNLRIA